MDFPYLVLGMHQFVLFCAFTPKQKGLTCIALANFADLRSNLSQPNDRFYSLDLTEERTYTTERMMTPKLPAPYLLALLGVALARAFAA